jgi:DNA-binding GntR family transcriptional regulator
MVAADSLGFSPAALSDMVAEQGPGQEPLHRRITRLLTHQIEQGLLPVGSVLPSELELARRLGVSRQTMRAGLDGLVRAGLLARRRGKGTVVLRPRFEQHLTGFYSVARELQQQGVPLETRVLARGRFAASDAVGVQAAEHLGLTDPHGVGYLWRLRLVDGEPLLLETITFPADLCPTLLQPLRSRVEDRGAAGFYDVLAREANLVVTRARELFRPVAVTGHEARLLCVADGTPVFAVERLGFVEDRRIEWRQTLIRGDRYTYVAELLHPMEDASPPEELRFPQPPTRFTPVALVPAQEGKARAARHRKAAQDD